MSRFQWLAEVRLMLEHYRLYWLNFLSGMLADVLFFYAILIGLKSVTKTSLPDIDLGSLLALYGVFQFTGALWRTFASNILNESLLGTIEHLSLARGGLLTQLTVRAFVLGLNGGLYAAAVLLVLYWVSGISLQPSWWWPLGVLAFLPINLGLAFLMGSLGLLFRRVDSLFIVLNFILLPYFLSLTQWQPYMAYLPFAPGAHLVRLGLTGGDFDWGIFLLALFQGLSLLAAGFLAMAYMYRMVRRRGTFGRF